MAVVTATEVTVLSNISASATTITASGLIPIVQERICMMTNNRFITGLYLDDTVDFDGSALTIVADNSYENENFLAGDDIFIYNSYRNDGFFTIASVTTVTITLASGQTITEELSGRSVLISVVKWPQPVKQAAALMIAYDYDVRPKRSSDVRSHSLGPFSETLASGDEMQFGYPSNILDMLTSYRMARII